MKYNVISTDDHLQEDRYTWTNRMSKKKGIIYLLTFHSLMVYTPAIISRSKDHHGRGRTDRG